MSTQRKLHWLIGLMALFLSCNRNLYIDRSQYVKDGEAVPTVDLNVYKSVQERPGQNREAAVALAISGGGSRASNFGVGIMMGLENIQLATQGNVLSEVDYISTVSGGGFAGGVYISSLFDHELFSSGLPFRFSTYVNTNIKDDLSISFTNSLLKGYFIPKTWVSAVDYGDALEQTINDHVLGLKRREKRGQPREIYLGDLFVPKTEPQIPVKFPMHLTNSTAMGTLAIFPFTPDMLTKHNVNGYTHNLKTYEGDTINPYQVPLAVGIKASGSFPVLVPNSTLHSNYNEERPYLHIMDGAMSDNQGYYTALEVLQQDQALRKVMIMIDADASGNLYTFTERKEANPPLKVFMSLAASGLYARRATLLQELQRIESQFGIKPIYLSFNSLLEKCGPPGALPEKINIKEEQLRLIQLLKNNDNTLESNDLYILYELLINIGTKYSIKPEEQELLFLSGQLITRIMEPEIRAAMKP